MAQVEIPIAVKDGGTGSAVDGASVWLTAPGHGVVLNSNIYSTSTDKNGFARFKGVEVGTYDLTIQYRRFKTL